MSEWEMDNNKLKKGYEEFSTLIQTNGTKEIIINMFKNVVCSNEWPEKYYALRDEYLPKIVGEKVSKFIFWYIFNYGMEKEFMSNIKQRDFMFLNYLSLNYTKQFIKAKTYNFNPLGYDEILYTSNAEKHDFNFYIYRNDGEKLLLRTETLDIFKMFTDSFQYLSQMLISNNINDAERKETIEKINEIRESLQAIEKYLAESSNQDE